MPILAREVDQYPGDLLNMAAANYDAEIAWWVFYTYPRREKQLMRHLLARNIPFYGPVVPRRFRSPGGTARTSYIPLFSNYVFVFGDEAQRYQAMASNCILKWFSVSDQGKFTAELVQISRLIEMGQPLTPVPRFIQGDRVRVTSGSFAGFEGTVIRQDKKIRLIVTIDFMQNGVLVELDDCRMERLEIRNHEMAAK
jgi:hypothetical protein